MHLSQRQPDGSTLRDHLQAVARAGGAVDPRLTSALQPGLAGLWEAYCELSAMRPSGMGVSAIPGHEYESWQRLSGVTLTPWEVDTLKAMDRAAMSAMAETRKH